MPTIRLPKPPIPENAKEYAQMAVSAAKNIDKVHLDYSPESLNIVDKIIGRFHRDRLTVEQMGGTLFAFGCYVGEVFVKHVGGKWCKEEDTMLPDLAGSFIVLELQNGKICNPVGKVFKRLQLGETENLPFFYEVFAKTD